MRTPLTNALFARALRSTCRVLFDEVNLDLREQEWVDADSFDAGILAAAHYLLARADRLDNGELQADL